MGTYSVDGEQDPHGKVVASTGIQLVLLEKVL